MKSFAKAIMVLLGTTFAAFPGQNVEYKVNGESFTGYYTSPSKNAPFILLVHDWDGLTDYEVKRADMLMEKGYAVFAVDLFGTRIRPTDIEGKKHETGRLYNNRERMLALLRGALETAKSKGANINNAMAMGYCFGGAAVLEFARSGQELKGFVSFHGGLNTPEGQNYSMTKGKVLILHGTADGSVTMTDFASLASDLEQKNIPHEMISYGGAPHAFTVFGSDRYRKDADEKSWRRFLEFLKETLE
jgi:dienelactone hydrolase